MVVIVQFVTNYYLRQPEAVLAITGNCEELGNWDPGCAPKTENTSSGNNTVCVIISNTNRIEFKWATLTKDFHVARWEECDNKVLDIPHDVCRLTVYSPWNHPFQIAGMIPDFVARPSISSRAFGHVVCSGSPEHQSSTPNISSPFSTNASSPMTRHDLLNSGSKSSTKKSPGSSVPSSKLFALTLPKLTAFHSFLGTSKLPPKPAVVPAPTSQETICTSPNSVPTVTSTYETTAPNSPEVSWTTSTPKKVTFDEKIVVAIQPLPDYNIDNTRIINQVLSSKDGGSKQEYTKPQAFCPKSVFKDANGQNHEDSFTKKRNTDPSPDPSPKYSFNASSDVECEVSDKGSFSDENIKVAMNEVSMDDELSRVTDRVKVYDEDTGSGWSKVNLDLGSTSNPDVELINEYLDTHCGTDTDLHCKSTLSVDFAEAHGKTLEELLVAEKEKTKSSKRAWQIGKAVLELEQNDSCHNDLTNRTPEGQSDSDSNDSDSDCIEAWLAKHKDDRKLRKLASLEALEKASMDPEYLDKAAARWRKVLQMTMPARFMKDRQLQTEEKAHRKWLSSFWASLNCNQSIDRDMIMSRLWKYTKIAVASLAVSATTYAAVYYATTLFPDHTEANSAIDDTLGRALRTLGIQEAPCTSADDGAYNRIMRAAGIVDPPQCPTSWWHTLTDYFY